MDTSKISKLFLVLGIGIGLLIASFLNMAYPKKEYVSYTDAQIIEKAKELGMLPLKEVVLKELNSQDESQENIEDEIAEETLLDEQNVDKDINEENTENYVVELIINKGDNSEEIINRLFEAGIIIDKEEFTKEIIGRKLQKKFKYGVYELHKEMEYKSIINLLTGK